MSVNVGVGLEFRIPPNVLSIYIDDMVRNWRYSVNLGFKISRDSPWNIVSSTKLQRNKAHLKVNKEILWRIAVKWNIVSTDMIN